MAYNSNNHKKKRKFIMKKYWDWKGCNEDIPDTFFVRVILRDLGHPMCYSAFMKGYKHYEEEVDGEQLSLF